MTDKQIESVGQIRFTKEEVRQVEDFLETEAGQKLVSALDNLAEAKNNLLMVSGMVSDQANFVELGRRTALHAVECRAYLQIADLFKNIGDYYAG